MRRQSLLVSLVAVASVIGIAPAAFAGEGGLAGAAAFTLDENGNVNSVAVAAAIGKNDAYANATSITLNILGTPIYFNNAYALGSAGAIDAASVVVPNGVPIVGGLQLGSVNGGDDPALGTPQANTFNLLNLVSPGVGNAP
jgi:hypothetical protein